MTGKPSCPVRREAARNRTRPQREPHRAADPTGWIMLHRRLARDYETLTASSEAMIHIASIDNFSKRITDETTPTWRGTY
jgi:transposase